jgi:hypothetical protein
MQFHEKRRQQFLIENVFDEKIAFYHQSIKELNENMQENADYLASKMRLSFSIAHDIFSQFVLKYTAGESIDPLRNELENIIAAYERYGEYLWKYEGDRNVPVFDFVVIDDYSQLMQLIGLCFLLHRRDLLPRLAALQDGLDAVGKTGEGNGGADALFEEFLIFGMGGEERYQSDYLCALKPYEPLFHALTDETNEARLKELNIFLKRWYKDLAGCGWHDSHRPDDAGNQGGYYGYWSFEAGAAVILLGIEDDSSLHQYLYYPKDLVAWCRANPHLSEATPAKLRCEANHPCPKTGYWWTPAKQNSRAYFQQGEVMPDFPNSSYGATIWQWDVTQ